MSKRLSIALLTLLLAGCGQSQGSSVVSLDAQDLEDFIDWKDYEQEDVEVEPFKAKPIFVQGTGTVRAAPDIAVLTGVIKVQADIEHKAMDEAAQIMNRVQETIAGKSVDISFTGLSTVENRDEDCLRHNNRAVLRNNDISNDNWFNKRQLNRPKDVRQKLRPRKSRIAQKVCGVTHVETYVRFTAWVKPSGEVSDYITAFTAAGVEQVSLFGFDFSNYDALYKQAAEKAVANARNKAKLSARIAGTQLTTIESFSVTGTERRRRFGQQAMLISPHGNRSVTPQQRISFSDRVIRSQAAPRNQNNRPRSVAPAPVASFSCWDGSMVFGAGQCPSQPVMAAVSDQIVTSPARVEYVTIPATYETVTDTVAVQEASTELVSINGQLVERRIPVVSKTETRRVLKTPASTVERIIPAVTGQSSGAQSNALRESMMSGSKTIRVHATLSYNYETPLDGVIFKTPEK